MIEENVDVIGEFRDGSLNKGQFEEIMDSIRTNQDYLDRETYNSLLQSSKQEGVSTLTKHQFVQCREYALFEATGVTRD